MTSKQQSYLYVLCRQLAEIKCKKESRYCGSHDIDYMIENVYTLFSCENKTVEDIQNISTDEGMKLIDYIKKQPVQNLIK